MVVLLGAACASVVMAASLLLPWLRTGRVERNAIEVVRVARLLGVTERASVSAAVVVLVVAPIVGSLAVLALAWRAYRTGAIALVAQSVTALGAGGVVLRTGGTRGIGPWSGPLWSVGSGLMGLAVGVAVLASSRRSPQAGGVGDVVTDSSDLTCP